MPRKYTRKTDIGLVPHETMLDAVKQVKDLGKSLRKVAKEKGISKSTLQRYLKKYEDNDKARLVPNYQHSCVFTISQEKTMVEYIKTVSKMYHGLTSIQTRQLAFQMAQKNSIHMPKEWIENSMAGLEWLRAFLSRHPSLSLRSPEATSLARATAFNHHTVNEFFDLLEQELKTTHITGGRIFNLDESGVTTVQKVPKVISIKGTKQVGQITSRERGELVTICAVVSASGTSLPLTYVFPRKNFKDIFLTGAPEGSLGLVSESGWMNTIIFYDVMKHIVQTSKSSKDNPIILILDNHESHLSLITLEYAKDNGVHIITLPPHTSHKTQPLDRSVFGPLKSYFNSEANSWMMRNPGKTITIYQMGQLIGTAWLKVSTPCNIIAGFKTTGVWPFDRHVFGEDEFLPASITDRPEPTKTSDQPGPSRSDSLQQNTNEENRSSSDTEQFLTPEKIRGYPKAEERKQTNRGRKRGKTMVATSTPELKRIREVLKDKEEKAEQKARRETNKSAKKKLNLNNIKKKEIEANESSSSEGTYELVDTDEHDSEDNEENDECEIHLGDVNPNSLVPDVYVLVEFKDTGKSDKSGVYYVALILSSIEDDGNIEVEFFRRSCKVRDKFVKPQVPDIADILANQIQSILPNPISRGTTSRTKDGIIFPLDFGRLDVR